MGLNVQLCQWSSEHEDLVPQSPYKNNESKQPIQPSLTFYQQISLFLANFVGSKPTELKESCAGKKVPKTNE